MGIFAVMDVVFVLGECLHGRTIECFGRMVYFRDPCALCERVLLAEGYWVDAPTFAIALAA